MVADVLRAQLTRQFFAKPLQGAIRRKVYRTGGEEDDLPALQRIGEIGPGPRTGARFGDQIPPPAQLREPIAMTSNRAPNRSGPEPRKARAGKFSVKYVR